MPVLRKLVICSEECYEQENFAFWSILSRCPAIRTLEEVAIYQFAMRMRDFTNFILKHKGTLRKLQIESIQWTDDGPSALCWFYGELSEAPQLEEIEQQDCFFTADVHAKLGIPTHLLKPWSEDEEDEDGFIWIHLPNTDIHHKGKDLVKQALEECAASMRNLWKEGPVVLAPS